MGPQPALSPSCSLQRRASVSLLTKMGVTDALDVNGRGVRVAQQWVGGDEVAPDISQAARESPMAPAGAGMQRRLQQGTWR